MGDSVRELDAEGFAAPKSITVARNGSVVLEVEGFDDQLVVLLNGSKILDKAFGELPP